MAHLSCDLSIFLIWQRRMSRKMLQAFEISHNRVPIMMSKKAANDGTEVVETLRPTPAMQADLDDNED